MKNDKRRVSLGSMPGLEGSCTSQGPAPMMIVHALPLRRMPHSLSKTQVRPPQNRPPVKKTQSKMSPLPESMDSPSRNWVSGGGMVGRNSILTNGCAVFSQYPWGLIPGSPLVLHTKGNICI